MLIQGLSQEDCKNQRNRTFAVMMSPRDVTLDFTLWLHNTFLCSYSSPKPKSLWQNWKTISFISSFITGVHCLNSVLPHASLFSLSCFPFTCYMCPHKHTTEHAVICIAVMKIKNTAEKLYMHEFCHVLIFPQTFYLQCSSHIGGKKSSNNSWLKQPTWPLTEGRKNIFLHWKRHNNIPPAQLNSLFVGAGLEQKATCLPIYA